MTFRTAPTLTLILVAALSGCVESGVPEGGTPIVSDPNSPAVRACVNAIAKTANISPRDVAVYDAPGSEAGTRVMATIAGATEPWTCLADNRGNVQEVMFTGSEGAL